ncbi:hypothetical protein LCGC14_2865780, partial [marine sediment metagenome]
IVDPLVVAGTNNDVDGDTNIFRCPFWAQDGIILGVQDAVTIEMSIRSDLSYSQQIYVHMNMGGMRMDEDRELPDLFVDAISAPGSSISGFCTKLGVRLFQVRLRRYIPSVRRLGFLRWMNDDGR